MPTVKVNGEVGFGVHVRCDLKNWLNRAMHKESGSVLCRMISWIDFGRELKAIRELTRTNTKIIS